MSTTPTMLTGMSSAPARSVASIVAPAIGAVAAVIDLASAWMDRIEQRRHLASLDDHLLNDLGLSRADVEMEAAKPFWRA